MSLINALPSYHIISAPAPVLAAPLAVLLLASINALIENGGKAAQSAITIAKSALCAAVLALAAALFVGPFQLALVEVGGLVLRLHFALLPAMLILTVCFTSLLVAKGTTGQHATYSAQDNIARWNIAVLILVTAMIMSGNAAAIVAACIIAIMSVTKLHSTSPGILGGLTTGSMNTPF